MYATITLAEGLTSDLLWTTFWIGLLCFWITNRDLSIVTTFFVVTLKISIPFLYFAFFYDETWNFKDDIAYQIHGIEMLRLGYNPITALLTPEGWHRLRVLSGGNHIIYAWWNLLGQYFFGEHYYSPVFLNIALTFITGYFLVRLTQLTGFNKQYAKAFLIFFLFHWELLAWSSFINLKDILVMTLTVTSLYCILKLSKKINLKDLSLLFFSLYWFYWLRVYITGLIIIATIIWLVLCYNGRYKFFIVFAALLLSFLIFKFAYPNKLSDVIDIISNLRSGFQGLFRMSLMPRFWAIGDKKSFLLFPSLLHWFFYLPTLWGLWKLWHRSKEISLLIIYLFLCLLLYGTFPENYQSSRRRVQVVFMIAWAQFHYLWLLTRKANFNVK